MKKIRFPRIWKGYGKLVSVLRRRVGRKRTEQLPAQGSEAERYENEQLAVMQHEAVQCEAERYENEQLAVMQHEAMQCEDELRGNERLAMEQHEDERCEVGGCEDEQRESEQLAEEQHAVVQREDEQRENEHHRKAEACNQQQCSLREFCLKKFSEKRDAHAAGDASPDKAKR